MPNSLEESVRALALLIEERAASDQKIGDLIADVSTRLRVLSSALGAKTTVLDDGPEAVETEEESEEVEEIDEEVPLGGDGKVPPEILPMVSQWAAAYGIDPAVLLAIEIWETGWYTSDAWRDRRNPGGMKTAPSQFRGILTTDRDPEHPTYLRFETWQEGIQGHALFLGRGKRYEAIHGTTDPVKQIEAVGTAGYAEGSPSWLAGVKGVLSRAQKLLGTTSVSDSSLGARIVASMRSLPDPFPYEPETQGGQLGCANVVSKALVDAGVLDKLELSVDGLSGALKAKGWTPIQKPYRDGDVIVWSPNESSNGHKHVGVLDADGSKVWALDNSSSKRKVICEDLAKNTRPVEQVLRAPGA